MAIAADMLGRCMDRKLVMQAAGLRRQNTLSDWLREPAFQEAVALANQVYIAELREQKSRIIAASLELIEAELAKANSKKRIDIAHSVIKTVL
jgi:hypothetical protein